MLAIDQEPVISGVSELLGNSRAVRVDEDPKLHFSKLKKIADNNNIKELSIGMSGDYEEALKYNPAYIRLGTILFGNRL